MLNNLSNLNILHKLVSISPQYLDNGLVCCVKNNSEATGLTVFLS